MEITEKIVKIASDVLLEIKQIFPDEDISLFTRTYLDLGIYGEDFGDLINRLDNDEIINWDNFDFTRYMPNEVFTHEVPGIVLGYFLCRVLSLLFFPFSKTIATRIWKNRYMFSEMKNSDEYAPLYIGDIVVSIFYGKFTCMGDTDINCQVLNNNALELVEKYQHL